MGLKLDMTEAYDRIEWHFLEDILRAFDYYNDKFIMLI